MAARTGTLYRRFGLKVRARRKRLHLSQEEVATYIGLNRTSVVNIEAGRQGPTLESLYALGDALDIDPRRLLP